MIFISKAIKYIIPFIDFFFVDNKKKQNLEASRFLCLSFAYQIFFFLSFFLRFLIFEKHTSEVVFFLQERNRNTITKSATEKNEEFLILRKIKSSKTEERNLFTTRIAFANFHFFFHHQVKGKMYVM
jgi:hypothetical protein